MSEGIPKTAADWFKISESFFNTLFELVASEAPESQIKAAREEAWGASDVARRTKALEDLNSPDPQVRAGAGAKIAMYKRWDQEDGNRKPKPGEERAILVDQYGQRINP